MNLSKIYKILPIYILISFLWVKDIKASGGNILFVDDDSGNSYENEYLEALNKYSFRYSSWNIQTDGLMSSAFLKNYNIVIWETGWNSLNADRESILQSYLDNGGNLFISGMYIASYTDFCKNYLHGERAIYQGATTSMKSNDEHIISSGLEFEIYGGFYTMSLQPDAIPLFYVSGTTTQLTGLCYKNNYKVVFLCFVLYRMTGGDKIRENLMCRILKWLGYYRVKISGYIHDNFRNPLSNVELELSGEGYASVLSDTNGHYKFSDFGDGYYIVTPKKEGYKFTPRLRSYTFLEGEVTDQDFIGEEITETKFEIINNLFNPTKSEKVKVLYEVSTTGPGSLKIYTANGELVKTFLDGDILAGSYEFLWGGNNNNNEKVASGVYFIHLGNKLSRKVKKIIIVK